MITTCSVPLCTTVIDDVLTECDASQWWLTSSGRGAGGRESMSMGAEMGVEMDLVTGIGLGGRGRERDWVCWGWRGGGGGERHLQTA